MNILVLAGNFANYSESIVFWIDLLIDSNEFMSQRSPNHMKMMRLTQAVKRLQAKLDIFESSLPRRDRGPLPNPPSDTTLGMPDDFLTEFLTDIDSNIIPTASRWDNRPASRFATPGGGSIHDRRSIAHLNI
jgi:hypothetical protein